jgi:hypothetical protein
VLLEYSVCNVPANPAALAIAINKGLVRPTSAGRSATPTQTKEAALRAAVQRVVDEMRNENQASTLPPLSGGLDDRQILDAAVKALNAAFDPKAIMAEIRRIHGSKG